jgi:hypothetical protein
VGALSIVVAALLPLGTASADPAPPAFVRGEASASADTIALRMQLGTLSVGYTLGRSIAHYQEGDASGEGRALDLEALPTLFGEVAACPGVVPELPKEALPPVTLAESGQPGATDSHLTQAYFPELQHGPSALLAGSQDAKATIQPSSWATTSTPIEDIGIFSVWGGRTTSTTQLNGHVREAVATTEADAIGFFGNILVLEHPKWTATAHSGDQTDVTGSFTVDGGRMFGIERTPDQIKGDLAWLADAASQLFSIVGFHLDMPQVNVTGKQVEVTPLTVRLADLPIGQQLIGPLFQLFKAQMETYYDQLRASGCEGQSEAQILRLLQGVISGTGTVALPIGGVTATTDDTYYPPAVIPPPPPPDQGAAQVADATQTVTSDTAAPQPVDTVAPTTTFEPPTTEPVDTVPVDTLPIDPIKNTAAPAKVKNQEVADAPRVRARGGDTGGVAALVGLLGVVAAIVLALADRWWIVRGRRRVIPE